MSSNNEPIPPNQGNDASRPRRLDDYGWADGTSVPHADRGNLRGIAFVVVVALVCVTAIGLLLTVVGKWIPVAHGPSTMTKMNYLAMAVHEFHDVHKTIPPCNGPHGSRTAAPYTFHVHLLPYLEQDGLDADPAKGGEVAIPVFLSALDPTTTDGKGVTNFPVNIRLFYGDDGKLAPTQKLQWTQITDGTSNTLLFSTTYQNCGAVPRATSNWLYPNGLSATFGTSMAMWQAAPKQLDCLTNGTAVSLRPESLQIVMCDRNTRTLTPTINPAVWAALHTPNGQEPDHEIRE